MAGYGAFAFCYDALTENAGYAERCETICNLLNEQGVGEGILLDFACGTGTLTAMLAAKGFEVIGVDASEEMLSVAQEKALAKGVDCVFLCQKMQQLDLFGTIDAAVCTLDSLNHLTDEDAFREALRRVALFMNDGGVFLFDVNTSYKHKHVLSDQTFVYDLDDVFCVWQNTFLPAQCMTQITLDLFLYDEENDCYDRETETFFERAYPIEQIEAWLKENRFEVVKLFDEATNGPLTETSERAVFVCKKHGTQFLEEQEQNA